MRGRFLDRQRRGGEPYERSWQKSENDRGPLTNVSYMANAHAAGQVWHWMTGKLRELIPDSI